MLFREGISLQFVKYAVQVEVNAVHDKEDIVKVGVETVDRLFGWDEDVQQIRRKYIIVHLSQLTHYHDFPKDLSAFVAGTEHVPYQLDGNEFASPQIPCLNYLAERALAEERYGLVAAANGLPNCVKFDASLLRLFMLHNLI